MLEVLCGNKNVARILLFLLVNEKCYGSQIQRLFSVSLTPIQKAFTRLEKAGIVVSFFEGKTRIYQFNPSYALLTELERLLRKAYSHLSFQEKKKYCFVKYAGEIKEEENFQALIAFWKRLNEVKFLSFQSKSKANYETGWSGTGNGEVLVKKEGDYAITFNERGSWKRENGLEMDFSNTYRWKLDMQKKMVSLEHLRFGADHAVFLFYLAPAGKNALESLDYHLCAEDAYHGKVSFDRNVIQLQWRVIGPKKDEEITYHYH